MSAGQAVCAAGLSMRGRLCSWVLSSFEEQLQGRAICRPKRTGRLNKLRGPIWPRPRLLETSVTPWAPSSPGCPGVIQRLLVSEWHAGGGSHTAVVAMHSEE